MVRERTDDLPGKTHEVDLRRMPCRLEHERTCPNHPLAGEGDGMAHRLQRGKSGEVT